MDEITDIHPNVATAVAGDHDILQAFDIQVHRAVQGTCELSATVAPAWVNAAGFAHGSVAFTLMDTACAYALSALEVRGVTTNANTTYVRGASAADKLQARAQVLSRTKRTASLRAEVWLADDPQKSLVAHGSFVFQLLELKRPADQNR